MNGRDLVPIWLDRSTVFLAASKLREVREGISREELKPVVDADYAHTSYAAKAEKLNEFCQRQLKTDPVAATEN